MKQQPINVNRLLDNELTALAWQFEAAVKVVVVEAENKPGEATAAAVDKAIAQLETVQHEQAARVHAQRNNHIPYGRPLTSAERATLTGFMAARPAECEGDFSKWLEEQRREETAFLGFERRYNELLAEAAECRAAQALVHGRDNSATVAHYFVREAVVKKQLATIAWDMFTTRKKLDEITSRLIRRRDAVIGKENALAAERKRAAAEVGKVKKEAAERVAHAQNQLAKVTGRPKK